MNIVCVHWAAHYTGGRGQYAYSEDYPRALKSQLRELRHELTVLTDTGQGRPLLSPEKYRGWYAKLEVFRPENRDLRPCLCIDLDTFIVGDIAPILSLDPKRFWLIRQFLGTKRLGESGLFIAPKDSDYIWHAAEALHSYERGDGDFLRQFPHDFIPDHVDGILSYKAHHLQNGYPKGARVIAFHGKPKPADLPSNSWAGRYWRRHAGIE